MRKLSIDSVFRLKKFNIRDVHFYYSYMLNYGTISHDPQPHLELTQAINKVKKINLEAGNFAHAVFGNYPDIDAKSMFHHIEYRQKSFKNYIPSKPLLDVLSKIRVDMPSRELKDIDAYFDLNGYLDCEYALVSVITLNESRRVIKITMAEKSNTMLTQYFANNLSESTLEDCLGELVYKEATLDADNWKIVQKSQETPEKLKKRVNLMANLLIYISNPNEDFKSQYNEFSKDNKKAQREKLEYTSKPFIPIGEGIEFLRLIREEEVGVVGHFRWQPCGVGRTQRKLTFVKPHVRTYKKFEGDSVEN